MSVMRMAPEEDVKRTFADLCGEAAKKDGRAEFKRPYPRRL